MTRIILFAPKHFWLVRHKWLLFVGWFVGWIKNREQLTVTEWAMKNKKMKRTIESERERNEECEILNSFEHKIWIDFYHNMEKVVCVCVC